METKPTDKMTDEQITEAVAREVMEYLVVKNGDGTTEYAERQAKDDFPEIGKILPFDPLHDANDALKVIRRLKVFRDEFVISWCAEYGFSVKAHGTWMVRDVTSLCRAICLAALAAVRSKR